MSKNDSDLAKAGHLNEGKPLLLTKAKDHATKVSDKMARAKLKAERRMAKEPIVVRDLGWGPPGGSGGTK